MSEDLGSGSKLYERSIHTHGCLQLSTSIRDGLESKPRRIREKLPRAVDGGCGEYGLGLGGSV